MKNQARVWDITVPASDATRDFLTDAFKKHAKKWAFQLERGEETGYLHFQCRISLNTAKRLPEIKKILGVNSAHFSITSNDHKNDFDYVQKSETRVDGPWSSEDRPPPRQIRELTSLYFWQEQVIESAKLWDTRTINIVFDEEGNHGKTTLKTYIGCKKIGRSIPFCNDYRDLMRMVMDTEKMPLYLFDLPRAISKDKLNQFYSAIETIKDGYAYDDRYKFREEYFDCPTIWVFTNVMPDKRYLSLDRWKFWRFTEKNNLQAFKPSGF